MFFWKNRAIRPLLNRINIKTLPKVTDCSVMLRIIPIRTPMPIISRTTYYYTVILIVLYDILNCLKFLSLYYIGT